MTYQIRIWSLVTIIILGISCTREPDHTSGVFTPGQKQLLLMHPTTQNIHTLNYLISEDLFPLPPDYRILGVYHNRSTYDFRLSETYLKENKLNQFALLGLDQVLDPAALFTANALTDTFKLLFEWSEGAIFFGGPDIPPVVYKRPTSLLTEIPDPARQFLETSFLFHLLGGYQDEQLAPLLKNNPEYRILGICLGMQTMNVATGGSMIQDIPSEVYGLNTIEEVTAQASDQQHRNYHRNFYADPHFSRGHFHRISIEPQTEMARVAFHPETNPAVLSSHHQGLDALGKGFMVTAWSMDKKIVEAIEHTQYPNVIGIQFHPEVISLYQEDTRLTFVPGESPGQSFAERFPSDLGMNFHKAFWKHIALQYH